MTQIAPTLDTSAIARLDAVFAGRDASVDPRGTACVGVFGNGLPETLIAAAGALPVHLALGHCTKTTVIDDVIEPFVDAEVRAFLNRLMSGAFDHYKAIVFVRDDAPALVAYQYASEWVRQGLAGPNVPPLFLFNLVHSDTPPVEAFNRIQVEKLFDFLEGVGLSRPNGGALEAAWVNAARRNAALAGMEARLGDTVSGAQALRWRNAGRFLAASEHADLLEKACEHAGHAPAGPRLGIVGSPLSSMAAYDLFETFGPVVCDLQPWGQVWPVGQQASGEISELLRSVAADPFCPRIARANAHRSAIVSALVAARCELVLCQLAQTDDTFGWEIPALAGELQDAGIGFVNLGFRDPEPDAAWLDRARKLIAAALEARP